MPPADPRRRLPAVGTLLDDAAFAPLLAEHPRGLVIDAMRDVLAAARGNGAVTDAADVPRGETHASPAREPAGVDAAAWALLTEREIGRRLQPSLRPVINATGVVIHTNLGRAPLAASAMAAIAAIAQGFGTLEYDLERGCRGSRDGHCTALLRELTGAEDALVVNNGAAALVLALQALAAGGAVAVSRGELVEIGGSFRVPDIMRTAGVRLHEVGTTNRTHLSDYERALDASACAIVKVHRSNFTLQGYTADVSVAELAPLAHARGVPLLHDFGSGLVLPLDDVGLGGEPTARDAVRAGPTLLCMSGDKLLGGPQAGIVLGCAEPVQRLRRHPLARALRVDKLTLAALEATLALYRDPPRARREIPVLAMLAATAAELRERADRLAAALGATGLRVEVVATAGTVGGGAFPAARIPSWAVSLSGDATARERRLRAAVLPVIARVAGDALIVELRSVPAAHDALLREALLGALAPGRAS